jgi:hypothetical protein
MHPLVKNHQPLWEKFFKTPQGFKMGLQLQELVNRPDATDDDYRRAYREVTVALNRWLSKSSPWN